MLYSPNSASWLFDIILPLYTIDAPAQSFFLLTPKVLAVTCDASKTTTFKADADDIQTVEGFDTDGGKFKIEGVSKKKDCAGASHVTARTFGVRPLFSL